MKILIASDKFKGSLSAKEVCSAIQEGLKNQLNPVHEITLHPMADGGDGSLEVLSDYVDFECHEVNTLDPLGRQILTTYYTANGNAFIELASASGMVLLKKGERNPLKTSTYGTGKMIVDAIAKGFQNVFLFLGGSATNDAGIGIAEALGYQFFDEKNQKLKPVGENLIHVNKIKADSTFNLKNTQITLLCDVDNPLFGPNGAAFVYAAQKGADIEQVKYLDLGLRNFSKVVLEETGIDVSNLKGGGASGGIAGALVGLLGAKVKMGFDVISNLTNLEKKIQQSDWVISGEGRLDTQSFQGKVIGGIANLCKKYKKPLALFVGMNELDKQAIDRLNVKSVFAIAEHAQNLDDAIVNGANYLTQMAADFKNVKIN